MRGRWRAYRSSSARAARAATRRSPRSRWRSSSPRCSRRARAGFPRRAAYAGVWMTSSEGTSPVRALARLARGRVYPDRLRLGRREGPSAREGRPGGAPEISLVPELMDDPEVESQLEDIDVDAPRVGIVMGSKSDMEVMQQAARELEERGILHEIRVMSAHREPDLVADYSRNAHMRGLRVIIAGAGISAALPGAVAAHTDLPVIGVPLSGSLSAAGGLDAILSIVQMPPIVPGAFELVATLHARAREHARTVCVGRTHGVHAEPTTFGVKLAGFAFEAHRNALRLERAFAQAAVGAISGAVGTYSATSPEFEARVLDRLGLVREDVSTQVVARDRHAELVGAIALAGAGLERLATEIRHLQRTEVREVQEPFKASQKGSSAMPHKRNPIKAEQIAGLARVLRANAEAALENVALWHERDISHSSVERIVLPDCTILIDYLQAVAIALIEGMTVDVDRMRANLELTHGALFSQRVLLALVAAGMTRDDAYRIVQELAQRAFDEGVPLRELLERDERVRQISLDLDEIFSYEHYVRYAEEIVGRLDVVLAPADAAA